METAPAEFWERVTGWRIVIVGGGKFVEQRGAFEGLQITVTGPSKEVVRLFGEVVLEKAYLVCSAPRLSQQHLPIIPIIVRTLFESVREEAFLSLVGLLLEKARGRNVFFGLERKFWLLV